MAAGNGKGTVGDSRTFLRGIAPDDHALRDLRARQIAAARVRILKGRVYETHDKERYDVNQSL